MSLSGSRLPQIKKTNTCFRARQAKVGEGTDRELPEDGDDSVLGHSRELRVIYLEM